MRVNAELPQLPGMQPAPPVWVPATGARFDHAAAVRLRDVVEQAMFGVPRPSITITRSAEEVLNLLGGAPRLRTIHDLPIDDPVSPRGMQRAMREQMERAKGTFGAGDTAYGVLLLRNPDAPAPVLDAFGGVALTLRDSALHRATFLATDSMLTAQRPATLKDLPGVVAERIARDAKFVEGEDMLDLATPNPRHPRPRGRQDIAAVLTDAPDAEQRIRRRMVSPDFGRRFRFIEAQVPAVTLSDIARIDLSLNVPAVQRSEIERLARSAGIPIATA